MPSTRLVRTIVLCFFTATLAAQSTNPRPMLRLLHGAAARSVDGKIDLRQLPPGAQVDTTVTQTLLLETPKSPSLGIVALAFHWEPNSAEQGEPDQCGVFFQQPDGGSRYVPVIGSPQTQVHQLCENPVAIGLAADPWPHPRLIFVFEQMLVHDAPVATVFSWNSASKAYDRDDTTTAWLWKQPKTADTVAQVRRILQTHP